ncbi:MAG: hypothetical protein FIA95_03140 [Gemmatimonadetes bacterium]|nr:hypothetical protein [Gemmatimonadota bacterium]
MPEQGIRLRKATHMEYTYYRFENCLGGYFEMPTSDARQLLPPHLQPVEPQHSRSIFAITCFEFTDSPVGAYNEVVLAVIAPPMVEAGKPLPKAGFYPFMVGTTSAASREHAIERWHLPHYMKDLDIRFAPSEGRMVVTVQDDGQPVLSLTVTDHDYAPAKRLYNCFMADTGGRYKANIFMEAAHSEHEEERGFIELHPHAMTKGLTLADISTVPFREEWYRSGIQTFEPLERI